MVGGEYIDILFERESESMFQATDQHFIEFVIFNYILDHKPITSVLSNKDDFVVCILDGFHSRLVLGKSIVKSRVRTS